MSIQDIGYKVDKAEHQGEIISWLFKLSKNPSIREILDRKSKAGLKVWNTIAQLTCWKLLFREIIRLHKLKTSNLKIRK